MLTYLRNLQSERDTLTAAATGITETAAREERDVTDAERASIETMSTRCAVLDDQLRTFSGQLESQRAYARLRQDLDDAEDSSPRREIAVRGPHEPTRDARGWGERFIESAEFRAYDGHGTSRRVELPGIFTRAAIDTGGIGGVPVPPYVYSASQPTFTTPLLDACGHVGTNNQSVTWVVDDGRFPLAGVVAEGALKGEANITITTESGTLQTYAHWKGITRQALGNIPLIQSYVENQLRGGIYAKLEADVAAALAALVAATDIEEISAADGLLPAIRTAIGSAQLAGYPNANTVVLNPADWAALDVSVFDSTTSGPNRQSGFWGLNPVPSADVPAGTAYVGDVKSAVTVFDEGTASVFLTDSHADYFIRNILVILSEIMALPVVTAPRALVRVVTPPVVPGARSAQTSGQSAGK